MKNLKSLSIIMAVMMISQMGMGNFAVSAMSPVGQGQSIGNSSLSNDLQKLKELQDILYLEPVDQEKLTKEIEELRTLCSNKEIDQELIMAMSLNYQRIPVLIPFLSKKKVSARTLPHCDQDFLTILLKNGIDITDLEDILKLNRHVDFKRYLEEELVMEMEKKGIEFDKSKVVIRKKSEIEKVIEEDDVESLRLLSNQANFDLNQKIYKENLQCDYREVPIVSFCVEKHAIKCFKFLLLNGSNPLDMITEVDGFEDKEEEDRMDGMSFGAAVGNLKIMEMIEGKGGRIVTKVGKCAVRFHQNHVLKWILQNSKSLEANFNWQEVFNEAIRFENLEGISLMLEEGVCKVDGNGFCEETPLHCAAKRNWAKIGEWLINKNVDIDAMNAYGETPLHQAILYHSVETGKLLIDRGADVNAEENCKYTPLHFAASDDLIEIGILLISKGANVNAVNDDGGETPLHRAAEFDSNEMGKLLISKGADINAKDGQEETPLHVAAENDANEVAELLISKGADINLKDWKGKTPLHMASEKQSLKMIELLISKGADLNAKDNVGRTPLSYAEKKEVKNLLTSKGAHE